MKQHFMRKITVWVAVAALLAVVSCLFPEQYKATIDIRRDGSYTLQFDGILTYLLARSAEIENDGLDQDTERELKEMEKEFLSDPHFTSVEYVGHSRYKVRYERSGTLDATVRFLDEEVPILSIERVAPDRVQISGMSVSEEDLSTLEALDLEVDGELKVKTNGKVIEHNAGSKPKLFGLIGSFKWKIRSPSDPAPYMLIEIDAEPAASNGTPEDAQRAGRPAAPPEPG